MQAISASMTEGDLTATSCTVGFVGADSSFTILSDADLEPHVAAMKDAEDAPAGMQATLHITARSCGTLQQGRVHWAWILC